MLELNPEGHCFSLLFEEGHNPTMSKWWEEEFSWQTKEAIERQANCYSAYDVAIETAYFLNYYREIDLKVKSKGRQLMSTLSQ